MVSHGQVEWRPGDDPQGWVGHPGWFGEETWKKGAEPRPAPSLGNAAIPVPATQFVCNTPAGALSVNSPTSGLSPSPGSEDTSALHPGSG